MCIATGRVVNLMPSVGWCPPHSEVVRVWRWYGAASEELVLSGARDV